MFCGEVKVDRLDRTAGSMRRVQTEAVAWSCAIACFRYGACTACAIAPATRSSF